MSDTSSDTSACQLLIDPPAEGTWNMAVDEVLLDATATSGQPTVRFYQWQRPTLSLGYFQRSADRATHQPSADADVVRRLSGGGAILHDREITYSLALPASHRLASNTQALYDATHQAIADVLNELIAQHNTPWRAELCAAPSNLAPSEQPFLCFQRRSAGDILLTSLRDDINHKVVGSAQRRRRGTVLQHGSVLLATSPSAPELPGLAQLVGIEISTQWIIAQVKQRIAQKLEIEFIDYTLPANLLAQTQQFQATKYANLRWTEHR